MLVTRTPDTREFDLILRSEAGSVVLARHMVRHCLRRWEFPEAIVYDSMMVISELVTNTTQVVRGSDIEIRISIQDGAPRLAVWDPSPELPQLPAFDDEAEGGRGLFLVASLSDRHGVIRPVGDGKVIWALMPAKESKSL